VRRSAALLREPISLILVVAIAASTAVTVFARQDLQTTYQAELARTQGGARPRLQSMAGALSDFERGGIGEELLRSTLGQSEQATAAALEPLSDMPELRGTFLDEPNAAAHRTSSALRTELDELDAVLQDHEALPQVVYRAQRVLSLAAPLEPGTLANTRRLWLETYARELARVDSELGRQVDDLARWRAQALPDLAGRGQWTDVRTRLTQARADLQLSQDRVRSLPAPPEALRSLTDYTTALGHLDRALQALNAYADARAPATLLTADQELAAYRSTRQSPLAALSQLAR
jgi:hypothetical protein